MAALRNQNARTKRTATIIGTAARLWATGTVVSMSRNVPPRRGGRRHCAVQQVGVSSPRFTGRPINICVTAAGHAGRRQRTDPTEPQRCSPTQSKPLCRGTASAADWPSRSRIIEVAVIAAAISPRPRPTAKRRRGHPDAHEGAVRVNSTIVVGWLMTGDRLPVSLKSAVNSSTRAGITHRWRRSAFQKTPLSRAKALESPPSRRDQAGFFSSGMTAAARCAI
jgi:hypothetical protein